MSYMDLPLAGIVCCYHLIINFKGSLVGLEQSHNDIEESAFAATGQTDKAYATSFFYCKIHILKYPWRLGSVTK